MGTETYTAEIDRQYQAVLGRHADSEGANYFLGKLYSGTMDLAGLVAALKNSAEGQRTAQAQGGGTSPAATPAASSTETAIDQLYQSILGRHADGDGLNYFLGKLSNGSLTLASLTDALKNSAEGQQHARAPGSGSSTVGTGTSATTETAIDQLYQSILGRHADNEGLSYFLGKLGNGSLNLTSLSDALKNSTEGQQHAKALSQLPAATTKPDTAGSSAPASAAEKSIDQLYLSLLGRHVDADALKYLLAKLSAGTLDTAGLVNSLKNSSEGLHYAQTHTTTTIHATVQNDQVDLVGIAHSPVDVFL